MQINSPSHTTTEPPQIVVRRENIPPKLSGKNAHRTSSAPKIWADADHCDRLAAVYLPRYNLPRWDIPCEPEAMRLWLDRMDMTEAEYVRQTNTSLDDFCALNPTWPLRAWLGTVLEMDRECRIYR